MAYREERCPWHNDRTASLKLMPSGWYCFGCRKRPTHTEVEKSLGKTIETEQQEVREKENLEESLKYIDSLPKLSIRGLTLPEDTKGYYVVWPDRNYYKQRLYKGKTRYLAPAGHSQCLFWAKKEGGNTLWIVEGEINSLSLAKSVQGDVCSPGSATIFDRLVKKHLPDFKKYSTINVVVDKDRAGIEALIAARSAFLYEIPFARYYQLEKDCNEIFCEKGAVGLREELSRSYYK